MKSRILLMIIFMALMIKVSAQPLHWKESLSAITMAPSTIDKEAVLKTEGASSMKYTFTDNGTPFFICDTFNVAANTTWNAQMDFYDNDPAATIYMRVYFFTSAGVYISRFTSTGTIDGASWQTITGTGTVPATAAKAYVLVRSVAAVPASFVSATVYVDNCKYTDNASSTNLIKNPGFEDWLAPSGFLSYKFEGLNPIVTGIIDKTAHTVSLTVPYVINLTGLVATFTLTDGTTAKVGATDQVSATTPNNFTSPVTYTLTKGAVNQDWIVTVTKTAPTTGKDIATFKFEGLNPVVNGIVTPGDHTVKLEVPAGTDVSTLIPTITLSPNATSSPLSGVANNFTAPATYTVTAQDGSTQDWVVTVTFAVVGQTTLFFEDFENKQLIPNTFTLINKDQFPMASGEERWAGDSCWLISTTGRPELAGTQVAMASSYVTMGLTDKVERWMILPSITLGDNSILSWQAMSTTTSGNYPDDYIVYIAPAVDATTPTVAYFQSEGNELIKVAPENWSAAVGRPGEGLANRSINLKQAITPSAAEGWFNKKVWIAFVLSTDLYTNPTTGIPNGTSGGSALAIDNIKVVNSPLTGFNEYKKNTLSVSIFPNPTTGAFKIAVEAESFGIADIKVLDLSGRIVFTNAATVNVGKNQIDVNLSNLHQGIYLINTTVNGKVNVSKLNVR